MQELNACIFQSIKVPPNRREFIHKSEAIKKYHARFTCAKQMELPRPIPRNSVASDHGCTSRIYFDNAGDNMTLTLYNVTLTSRKPC